MNEDGRIRYKQDIVPQQEQIRELFASVDWISSNYSERLYKAFQKAETLVTAWDGDKLTGLVEAIDDGEVTAYIHYVLVHKDYHGKGIGSHMLSLIKEKYKDYLYVIAVCEEKKNIPFYQNQGFEAVITATPVQIFRP